MLPNALIEICDDSRHRRRCKALLLRVGIAVESGFAEPPIARPESAAAHFVRIRLPHDPGTQVWRVTCQRGRDAPRESSDCHVKAAPEEVHRTNLPEELPPEPGEDPFDLNQDVPEPPD